MQMAQSIDKRYYLSLGQKLHYQLIEIDSSFRECLCEFCFCAKLSGFTHEPLNRMYLRNNGFLFE